MCRDGENEELRYSIRSILHFFPDAEIWIVGGRPSWYVGNHISVKQASAKYYNVKNNIAALVENENINSEFIYMNDDFYLTDITDLSIPHHRGYLDDYLEGNRECCSRYIYIKLINKAFTKIKKVVSHRPLNYELHVPIMVSKGGLQKAYRQAFIWRSFYGNYYKLGGKEIQDCKFYQQDVKNTDLKKFIADHSPFLSSNDNTFNFILDNYLKDKFPNKSKCEA